MEGGAEVRVPVHRLELEGFILPIGANDRITWSSLATQLWGRRGSACGGA